MKGRLLSVSYDPSLLATRDLLLKYDGYEVTSALGFVQAIASSRADYDLIIIGHSIPQDDKRAIVAELRKRGCQAPVLSLLRHGEHAMPEAAKAIDPDPQLVLDTVRCLVAERQARA